MLVLFYCPTAKQSGAYKPEVYIGILHFYHMCLNILKWQDIIDHKSLKNKNLICVSQTRSHMGSQAIDY